MPNHKNLVRVGVGVLIWKDGAILLGKRHPDPHQASSALHGEGTWTLPGGKLEFKETLTECAQREVREETGIKVEGFKLISISDDMVSDAHFITIGFLCSNFEGDPGVREPEKIVDWKWFHVTDFPTPLFFPSERIIRNYLSGTICKS